MMKHLASQRGATLIEVISAVTVFAVTAVGLSPTLLSTRKMAAVSNSRSVATTLAADKIERIRTMTTTELLALGASGTDGPWKADGTSGGIYTRSWTVTPNYQGITGISQLAMTVSWRDRPTTQSVTLVTLVRQ